ncbi:MAG: MBL fold metallo-hydrolase [Actinobacteria bacterium]|nr:MBL fold metallo-hydrolase [Actinomycetota bacterium]
MARHSFDRPCASSRRIQFIVTKHKRARSFEPNADNTVTTETGHVAHRDLVDHSRRLVKNFYKVGQHVWCLVGNGLSNQTFIDAPDGVIAIDTGESNEEMRAAIAELRFHTKKPIVAVLYTHFHYVAGTKAVLDDSPETKVEIYGHSKIAYNRVRTATEIAPSYNRGLVEQFAITLPPDGPDGNVNVGLGRFYRNPEHKTQTNGFIKPVHTFDKPCTLKIAGLDVEVTPAPSDADDSVTYWFKSLGCAVNNLVWPVLFNVFAIRGEEYRDPQIMLEGIDHLLSLNPTHLVGAHGMPISGNAEIMRRVTRYRDSIQFLWDQTVRLTNRGYTSTELGHEIRLPDFFDEDNLTSEFYGVTEHHVRQIRAGLLGWFDGDPANLFPLPREEHSNRMITGFGGRDIVRQKATEAIDSDDLRWACELSSWLVNSTEVEDLDKLLLAKTLRLIAQRTTAANIRNWCLARARHLDGTFDLTRFNQHRLSRKQILSSTSENLVSILRVLLAPERASEIDTHICFSFTDRQQTGLHIRNCVACPTDGNGSDITVKCNIETWADILAGDLALSVALSQNKLTVKGDTHELKHALQVFDIKNLQS